MVSPETVTGFTVPTFLVSNAPLAPLVTSVTASPDSTPTSDAPETFRVAVVVPS